ncbi:MAG: bifunctional UDP-N-acetylglucosamine diphosphorylase/glucosamine-1-phosphate N-acetyltransferase GlmU, partial [Methylococcales bacterium]|nr:bifunctional UDP-N-acetylglucosamine diphosphorylase/glucosamine-1-phosphate N-acetyltransferase GlmU [Methylococcales bacterium]
QILVLYGDVPLTEASSLQRLIESGDAKSIRILTAIRDDPTGYGRIVRDNQGAVQAIVEQKDADAATQAITEINSGIMVLPCKWLQTALPKLSNSNAQGEYYLTDLVALAVSEGLNIATECCSDPAQVEGVNDRKQLAYVERVYQQQQADLLMTQGVTLYDPARLDVRGNVTVGEDITIDVNVILAGNVSIGNNISIGANCVITDAVIGDNTVILPNCVLEDCTVGESCTIGPYARLRPATVLADGAKLGNFVETKNANIGAGSKVNHLSYIGDTEMGAGVNIGAGTITCNYDGANKHRTVIEDNVFIGSDSQLIAPITIGKGATVAAGTTVRKDAPAGALTLSKSDQRSLAGWKRPQKGK